MTISSTAFRYRFITGSLLAACICLLGSVAGAEVITFESLVVPGNGFYNGDVDATGPERDNFSIVGSGVVFGAPSIEQEWTHQGLAFSNTDVPTFDSPSSDFWAGWAWSNVQDSVTEGVANQFAARPGGGSNGNGGTALGETYLIAFGDGAYFNVPESRQLESVDLTNTTYAAFTVLRGNPFSKAFGGPTGNDPDHFQVILSGHSGVAGTGSLLGEVAVSLADYRFDDNTQDTIMTNWNRISLASIASARSVSLRFESTDADPDFGINTPAYVALDNLTFVSAVPEPSSFACITCLALIAATRRRTNQQRQGESVQR